MLTTPVLTSYRHVMKSTSLQFFSKISHRDTHHSSFAFLPKQCQDNKKRIHLFCSNALKIQLCISPNTSICQPHAKRALSFNSLFYANKMMSSQSFLDSHPCSDIIRIFNHSGRFVRTKQTTKQTTLRTHTALQNSNSANTLPTPRAKRGVVCMSVLFNKPANSWRTAVHPRNKRTTSFCAHCKMRRHAVSNERYLYAWETPHPSAQQGIRRPRREVPHRPSNPRFQQELPLPVATLRIIAR
jgi:hypothetical protein